MPWKLKDRLKIHGGPGLPPDYFRKPPDPTACQLALRNLEKQLLKMELPRHYAEKISRLGLRPRALRDLLKRLVDLRLQLEEASGRLADIRQTMKALLAGTPEPGPVAEGPVAVTAESGDYLDAFYDD